MAGDKVEPGELVWITNNPASGTWMVKRVAPKSYYGGISYNEVTIVNQETESTTYVPEGLLQKIAAVVGPSYGGIEKVDEDCPLMTEDEAESDEEEEETKDKEELAAQKLPSLVYSDDEEEETEDTEDVATQEDCLRGFGSAGQPSQGLLKLPSDDLLELAGAAVEGLNESWDSFTYSSPSDHVSKEPEGIGEENPFHSTMIEQNVVASSVVAFEETSTDYYIPLQKDSFQSEASLSSINQETDPLKSDASSSTINQHTDPLKSDASGSSFNPQKSRGEATYVNNASTPFVDEVNLLEQAEDELADDREFDSFNFKSILHVKELVAWVRSCGEKRHVSVEIQEPEKIKEECVRVEKILQEMKDRRVEIEAGMAYQEARGVGLLGGLEVENLEIAWKEEMELLEKRKEVLEVMEKQARGFLEHRRRMLDNLSLLHRMQLALDPDSYGENEEEMKAQEARATELIAKMENQKRQMDKIWQWEGTLSSAYREDHWAAQDKLKKEALDKYCHVMGLLIGRRDRISDLLKPSSKVTAADLLIDALIEMEEKIENINLVGDQTLDDVMMLRGLRLDLEERKKELVIIHEKLEKSDKGTLEKLKKAKAKCVALEASLSVYFMVGDDYVEITEFIVGESASGQQVKQEVLDEGSNEAISRQTLLNLTRDQYSHVNQDESVGARDQYSHVIQDESVGDLDDQNKSNSRRSYRAQLPPDQSERRGRLLTAEEMEAVRMANEGETQTRNKARLLGLFEAFLRSIGEYRPIKDIPTDILDAALATFWHDYMRSTDNDHPDTSTLDSYFSRLNAAITHLRGGRNPNDEKLAFPRYTQMKKDKKRLAKRVPGNGQGAHVVDVLYPQEVRYLIDAGLVNGISGWGIIRTFIIHFLCGVSQRPILDQKRMPLDAVKITRDSEGKILYADVNLQFDKRDQGETETAGRSPRILPLSNKYKCFFYAWDRFLLERSKLGPQFLEGSSPLFLEPRNTKDFKKNDCLFHPKPMSEAAIGSVVYNLAVEGGLNLKNRKVTNMSLRQLNFQQQIMLDITPEQGQTVSNHRSAKSRARYNTNNIDQQEVIGGAMMAATTGSAAILPVPAGVRAVQHLKGPKTSRSRTDVDMETGTVVEAGYRRVTETTMEAGESVQKTLTKFDVTFDGVAKPEGFSLYAGYMRHANEKYLERERSEEHDEDMERMLGPPDPDCPPLPEPTKQAEGVVVTQGRNTPRYTSDGNLTWKPPVAVWKKVLKKNGEGFDAEEEEEEEEKDPSWKPTKRKQKVLAEKNGEEAPRKKNKPAAKKVVKELALNELVFAREPKEKKGRMWPGQVVDIYRHDTTGVITGFKVDLFCHKTFQTPTAINVKQVKPLNEEAFLSWANPAFSRVSAEYQQSFTAGMAKLNDEMAKRGIQLVKENEEDGGGDNKENNKVVNWLI